MIVVRYIGKYSKKKMFEIIDAWSKIPEYEYWKLDMVFNDLTI